MSVTDRRRGRCGILIERGCVWVRYRGGTGERSTAGERKRGEIQRV